MNQLIKLIDLSRCTACRGCQVACKQWNEQPASKTHNFGSYQNPPGLEWNTWTLIRFQEHVDQSGRLKWLFRKDGCMHCTDAACIKVCPTLALYHTEFGTVNLDPDKCIGCKACIPACPFGVPKLNNTTNKVTKCDLCYTRLQVNQPPACVLSCPTGALQIGDKDTMLGKAYHRVKELGGDANVYGDQFVDGTHVVYVLPEKPEVYDNLPTDPKVPLSVIVWKDVLKPAGLLVAGGVVAGAFLHYITHGPKHPEEENTSAGGNQS
jgi:formate dehydrogenase beta subunit